jgi:nitrate/TMAO reductase-like tetraheme cytochrome c subunit
MKTSLQAAFHDPKAAAGTCIDCHKQKGGPAPVKCLECHKKK